MDLLNILDYEGIMWDLSIDWFEYCEEHEISSTQGQAAQFHWHYLLMSTAWGDL